MPDILINLCFKTFYKISLYNETFTAWILAEQGKRIPLPRACIGTLEICMEYLKYTKRKIKCLVPPHSCSISIYNACYCNWQ